MKKFSGILLVIAVLLIAAAYAYSYTNDVRPASGTNAAVALPYIDSGSVSTPGMEEKKAGCNWGSCDKSAKSAGDYKGKCGTKNRDASKTGEKKNGGTIVESA